MLIRPSDISRKLAAIGPNEVREVGEYLSNTIEDARCVGILSEMGQRLFTLREIEECQLDEVRNSRHIHPDSSKLMFQESLREETIEYLSELLAKEYLRSGCEPVVETNYIMVGKNFFLYQRPNTDAPTEEEGMERFYFSTRTRISTCGLLN